MYVFKVKSPQQSKSRYHVYDIIETMPPGPPSGRSARRPPVGELTERLERVA
jgi:hypothetical protein